jgi:hypothetical protein
MGKVIREGFIYPSTEAILGTLMAAKSWKEAKETAEREGEELVFHNYDTREYGACSRDRSFGRFVKGEFVEQRCICMPAKFSPEELEKKERDFLTENPGWAETG